MTKRRVANLALIERRLPVILAAATKQFAAHGFHKVSVHDVAGVAEVSVGMIYQYVDDKQELLYKVIDYIVCSYEAEMKIADASVAAALPRLCDFVFGIARVVDRQRAAAKLGYSEAKYLAPSRLKDIKDRERRLGVFLEEQIETCISAGKFAPCDAHRLAYHILIYVQSWPVSAWRLGSRTNAVDYTADGISTILRGLVKTALLEQEVNAARSRCLAAVPSRVADLEDA